MWTRNYQNLINARVFTNGWNISTSVVSRSAFDDSTKFVFKSTSGGIYDINSSNDLSSYGNQYTRSAFIHGYTFTNDKDSPIGTSFVVGTSTTDFNHIYLYFGSGTDSENFDDYTLTDISGISAVGSFSNKVSKDSNNNYVCTVSGVIKSTNDCTINEFGLFRGVFNKKTNSSSYTSSLLRTLIYRKVLDTPISLTAEQTASVSFSITLPTINIIQT